MDIPLKVMAALEERDAIVLYHALEPTLARCMRVNRDMTFLNGLLGKTVGRLQRTEAFTFPGCPDCYEGVSGQGTAGRLNSLFGEDLFHAVPAGEEGKERLWIYGSDVGRLRTNPVWLALRAAWDAGIGSRPMSWAPARPPGRWLSGFFLRRML